MPSPASLSMRTKAKNPTANLFMLISTKANRFGSESQPSRCSSGQATGDFKEDYQHDAQSKTLGLPPDSG